MASMLSRRVLLLAWGLCLLQIQPLGAQVEQPLSPDRAQAVDQAVQTVLTEDRVPGVALGLIEEGRIVYLKGYGLASLERQSPVTTDSVFNWASNSKPVAAVLAMQLVQQGRLDLDADIRNYVPEFPDKGHIITTRHLLCHQSGIPHYSNGVVLPFKRQYVVRDPFVDPLFGLDKFSLSPLIFEPGEKVAYSSHAYVLLCAVVQRAGNEDFTRQLTERIVKPLGIASFQGDETFRDQPDWVTGYRKTDAGVIEPAPEEAHYWKHGAGGFKANIVDFARWARALLEHRLVSADMERQMWTRQTTRDGQLTEWGLGFVVATDPEFKVSHNGSQTETATRMVLYPQRKVGFVILCNASFAKPERFLSAVETALAK